MLEYLFNNSQTKNILNLDMQNKAINHAYMIVCEDSTKVKDYAVNMACMLLCESESKPCFSCASCRKVMHGTHSDVLTFPQNKALTVDETKTIISESYILPVENDKKIIIINNIDDAKTQAQNHLLKTLEEPCNQVVFILTAVNEYAVLPTIRSRVKIIREHNETNLDLKTQVDLLNDKKSVDSKIFEFSSGNLDILNSLSSHKKIDEIFALCFDILKNLNKSGEVLQYSYKLLEFKEDFQLIISLIELILKESVVYKYNKELINLDSYKNDLEVISKKFNDDAVYKIILKSVEINEKLKFNCNINMIIDNYLLYILEVIYLCQKN